MPQLKLNNRYTYDVKSGYLGSGGNGDIYLGYDEMLGQEVAIKIAERGKGEKPSFNEFDFINDLADHENICNYKEVLTEQQGGSQYDYAIIQYYPLGTVTDQMIAGLSNLDKYSIADGLLNGIHHLHRNNIIHRDLKWTNVLVSRNVRTNKLIPKITDFGLSKKVPLNCRSKPCIKDSDNSGTPAYMPPEKFHIYYNGNHSSKGLINYNYDMWSVGVMLYELFIGVLPFPIPKDGTYRDQINAIVMNGIPLEIEKVPKPYRPIVKECLIKNPFERKITSKKSLAVAEISNDRDLRFDIKIITQQVEGCISSISDSIKIRVQNRYLIIGFLLLSGILLGSNYWTDLSASFNHKGSCIYNLFSSPSNTENVFNDFSKKFNEAINQNEKFNIYSEYKKTLKMLISNSTVVLYDNIVTDFEVQVMRIINSENDIKLEIGSVDDQGYVEYIKFIKE